MRNLAIAVFAVIVIGSGSLFFSSSFDRTTSVKFANNPLWDANNQPKANELTHELQNLGLAFRTGMGEEAYPTGMGFAELDSDKYWIVTYLPASKEVYAFCLIHGATWSGHRSYERRFRRIQECISQHANDG